MKVQAVNTKGEPAGEPFTPHPRSICHHALRGVPIGAVVFVNGIDYMRVRDES